MTDDYNISEFLTLDNNVQQNEDEDPDDTFFNMEKILTSINLYKIYKPKVGRGEIKTMKKMWDKMSHISNKFRITIMPSKCENKFRVLERNYKKVTDNNNKTGRGRKDFPYEKEFDEIFGKKVNIRPKILLTSSSSSTITPSKPLQEISNRASTSGSHKITENIFNIDNIDILPSAPHIDEEETVIPVITIPEQSEESQKRKRKRSTPSYTKRNDILTEIKNDFKAYYTEKLKIQKEKLEIEREKLAERKKRNEILQKNQRVSDDLGDIDFS